MKKTLLLGLLAFAGLSANAQQFPNFAATDINGGEHDIQAYLADGKTVLMDISATWCAPCWGFHSAHTLEKIYQTYGQGGSNEVVVIFVEGDIFTPLEQLYGTGVSNHPNNPLGTQGNWTEGVSYPIINVESDDLNDALELTGFPSLYRICPDGTYVQIPNNQFGNIQNIINSMNVCGTLEGASNHAKLDSGFDMWVCEANGNASTQASFTNYGTNAITTATFNIKDSEGNIVATKTYNGNLAKYATTSVTFDDAAYSEGEYTIEIAGINNVNPFHTSTVAVNVHTATETVRNLKVNIFTDNYPSEISWAIKDSEGVIRAEGGPYQAGTADEWGGGGPDANTTKTHNILLPEGVDCYTVELYDEFGDGWKYGATPHGIEITEPNGTSVFLYETGNLDFGDEVVIPSAVKSNGTLNNKSFEAGSFAVYPNPTSGILNFTTQEPVSVTVLDITGKVVFSAKEINNGGSINLSSLQSGMYIAKINGQNAERIEKIVIQ